MLARIFRFILFAIWYITCTASHDGRARRCFTRYDFVWGPAVFSAVYYFRHMREWEIRVRHLHRDAMRRWHTADVVADRAGFVDNEPSFMNGSPVTKPGRLRPCLILFLMLPLLLPYWSPSDTTIHYIVSLFNFYLFIQFCRRKYISILRILKILEWHVSRRQDEIISCVVQNFFHRIATAKTNMIK